MCQDCGSGGGRSVEPKSMLNRICCHWYIHAVRKCQRDACHACVRDVSWMCQGCVRDELWMHSGVHVWADLTCGCVRCKLDVHLVHSQNSMA